MLRRERRTKLEIFHDILDTIQDLSSHGELRPTRVQQKCNISYDKFSRYLDELAKKNLVTSNPHLYVTDKGKKLLHDYGKINDFILKMRLEYLSEGRAL